MPMPLLCSSTPLFPTPPLSPKNFHMFPWYWVDGFWATKSEGVGLIVRAISFQDFQPRWSWSTNVTDRWTSCNRNTALCTIVHLAVLPLLFAVLLFTVVRLGQWRWSMKQSWIGMRGVCLDRCMALCLRTTRKIQRLGNYCDWMQSACQLRRVDYSSLDILNVKVMQTNSSDVWRWRLRAPGRGKVWRRLGGIVSKGIWRVLTCPMRMLRIGIIGDWKSRGNRLTPVYLKIAIKMVCICVQRTIKSGLNLLY